MSNEKLVHNFHILLPQDLYDDIRTLLPVKGQATVVIRGLLRAYLKELKMRKDVSMGMIENIAHDRSVFDRERGYTSDDT